MKRNTLKYGFYSFLGIALFFVLMKFFNLEDVSILRAFNLVFIIYFSNALARKNIKKQEGLTYLENLASLFLANVFTLVLSIASFYLYITFVDTAFLSHFVGGILWQKDLSIWQAVASLLLEGIAGAVIVSFTLMQYWKDVKQKQVGKAKHA